MKKMIFTLLCLLMITSASALEYQYMPLVKDGKKWVEYYENYEDYENDLYNQSGIICYQLKGVSEINGITYHNLYATINNDKITDNSTPIAYVREQDKKVFVMINGGCNVDFPMGYHPIEMERCQYFPDNNEYLIYDFNDIKSPYESGSFTNNYVETNQTVVNGQLVNIYYLPTNLIIYFNNEKQGFIVQEGVGALHEVFINPWPLYPTNGLRFNLAFVEDDGHYLYRGAYYEKAKELMGHEYLPVLSEGKSWEVATVKTDSPSDTTGVYDIYVAGDTLVNNLTCKKIAIVPKNNQKSSMTAVAYEENGKVWKMTEDGTKELLFDMGLDVNESFDAGYVLESDIITLNGVSRKRLVIDSGADCDDYLFYVVEGIGISSDKWLIPRLGIADVGEFCTMLSCSENGETVFIDKDFKKKKKYVSLVREGVVWEYVGYYQEHEMEYDNPQRYNLYTLEFSGTTSIDGKLYYKIYRTEYDKLGNAREPYLAAYVREEDKVVTAIENTNHYYWWMIPKVLYDFNETMFLPYEAYFDYGWDIPYDYHYIQNVSSIEVEVGGTIRKGYYIDNENDEDSFKTIEGIGVDCGFGDLLIPYRNYCTCENPLASLAAVYENGQLVYKGRAYDQAQQMKRKKEDVNGDGHVTAADVTALYDFLLGNNTEAPDSYDVSGDGAVTAADITAIYNIILGANRNH